MRRTSQIPPVLAARAAALYSRARVHAPRGCIGRMIENNHERFTVFRRLIVRPGGPGPAGPGALYAVRFEFARFPEPVNRILSLIPIPLIVAQPGFRSKTWLSGETTGAFLGVYEWDTVDDALRYRHSLPLRLMKGRARPGTVYEFLRDLRDPDRRPIDLSGH